ncbi:MAG TPA: efflux RND transporter periplasmic adaptor subunit [Gemmatimonadaceae bacterium]|jgi:Cu(I)/Ag(I) efflux system membrane fusion protein|nr:efflux RND transporter periplasmic adaptor subunit [Gemmatimonadaceae bacterium]
MTTESQLEVARPRVVRTAIYAAVIVVAVIGVYFATRGKDTPAPAAAAHVRSGAPASGDLGKSVTLSAAETRRIGVTYATAQVGALAKQVRTVGQVTFDETRVKSISPKIDGWVEQLYVNATGQPVSAGQPLLTIYSPMLVSAQEELLLAKRLESDVSGASSDARQNASDLLASARRRLAYWDIPERQIAQIERSGQVEKTLTLRASAGGYVLEKNVLAGQKIMAGDALYKVADLSTVWVEGEVFEQDIATVRVGQAVHADFDALPGEHRLGRISYIYPTLDPQTRTVRVRVVLSNSDLRLKPGMYATILIAGTERANVLTVPRSAVLATGERSIIFVRDASGSLTPREVSVGAANDERVEILRGLSPGETVVSSATFLVDAESNLGTALGGMGNMPGMDMTTPPKPLPAKP